MTIIEVRMKQNCDALYIFHLYQRKVDWIPQGMLFSVWIAERRMCLVLTCTCDDIHPARAESSSMAVTASRTAADQARRSWANEDGAATEVLAKLVAVDVGGELRTEPDHGDYIF